MAALRTRNPDFVGLNKIKPSRARLPGPKGDLLMTNVNVSIEVAGEALDRAPEKPLKPHLVDQPMNRTKPTS